MAAEQEHEQQPLEAPLPLAMVVPKPTLAHGFKFQPTDEELVVYFLRRKVLQKPFRFESIAEIDIYSLEPWELQGFCAVNSREAEWHFFTRTEKKYTNGNKMNRATSNGFWKATGRDREVHHKSDIIGMKKTLVYHVGRAPAGRRTDWLMHEYRLTAQELEKASVQQVDAFLLCKVFLRKDIMGRRAIPFNEQEWENDADILVPCEDAEDEDSEVVGFNLSNNGASSMQAVQLLEKAQGFKSLGIREREEDDDDEAAVYLDDKGKKPKLMLDFFSGGGKGGSDYSSSSATILIPDSEPTKAAPVEFSSGLLDFSFTSQSKLKENHGSAAPKAGAFNSSSLENSLPPGYLKFITDLEEERDTLKHALMNSEATVSCLQADNDRLAEEISRLRSLLIFPPED